MICTMRTMILTKAHLSAMHSVRNGRVVFDRETARLLREVQAFDETLVEIIEPDELLRGGFASPYDLHDEHNRLCWFGALLTVKGE